MSVTESEFVNDLSRLRALARVDLPQLANVYTRLNREVAGTASSDADAFGGTRPSPVYQAWTQLRNQLEDALGHTATGLEQTSQVVDAVAASYEATDQAAAASLNVLWRNGPPADMQTPGDEQLPSTLPPVVFSS